MVARGARAGFTRWKRIGAADAEAPGAAAHLWVWLLAGYAVLTIVPNKPLSWKDPERVSVLHRRRKEGLGRAYTAGFKLVLDRGYDVVLQMDADLSHDPSYVPLFLERIESCDLVLGSRYLQGGGVVNWGRKRLLLSRAASAYVRAVTGMPCSDSTGGFKCWRRETLEAIGLESVFSSGYLFQIEMTYKAFRKGLRVAGVPIVFFERRRGRSKMDFRIIAEAFWGVLKLKFRH